VLTSVSSIDEARVKLPENEST